MTANVPEMAVAHEAAAAGPCPAVVVSHLRKAYGEAVAVDDVSFSVAEGEIFGLLGPIGDWTPLGAAFAALQHALQTGFPPARFLLVLAGYALVFGALAVRYFRWE